MSEGTDTFTVFRKQYPVHKMFQASVVWKIYHIWERAFIEGEIRSVISPVFQCSNYVFDIEMRPYPKYDPEVYIYIRKLNHESNSCAMYMYYKLKIFNLNNQKVHDISSFDWIRPIFTQYKQKIPTKNLLNPKDAKQYVTIFLDIVFDETNRAAASLGSAPGLFRNAIEELQDAISSLAEHTNYVSLSRDFEELYDNPVSSDVTLKLGREEIPAHRCVLSRSSVFRAMFTHCNQETQQNAVCIEEIESKTFKDLLRYMYCGKVRQLTQEEVLKLYDAANRYQLIGLVTICRDLMT